MGAIVSASNPQIDIQVICYISYNRTASWLIKFIQFEILDHD